MKELTIEELKQMPGQPVWCLEEEAYGIVMCDKIGQWAGIPFLHGVWYSDDDGVGVEFNHNIIGRKLKCFRVEDKKEIAMSLQNKEIDFGGPDAGMPELRSERHSESVQKAARSRATTMNKSEKYSEIILLGQMLQERKIEHEQHDLYDGYQIIVPLPEPTKEISVIEHQCSYGSIMNLLEIWADGSIQGYLSAKQTLKIIERIKARESPR